MIIFNLKWNKINILCFFFYIYIYIHARVCVWERESYLLLRFFFSQGNVSYLLRIYMLHVQNYLLTKLAVDWAACMANCDTLPRLYIWLFDVTNEIFNEHSEKPSAQVPEYRHTCMDKFITARWYHLAAV
jgi:hypothetical protein